MVPKSFKRVGLNFSCVCFLFQKSRPTLSIICGLVFLSTSPLLFAQQRDTYNKTLFGEAKRVLESGDDLKGIDLFEEIRRRLVVEGNDRTEDYFFASTQIMLGAINTANYDLANQIVDQVHTPLLSNASEFTRMEYQLIYGKLLADTGGNIDQAIAYMEKAYQISQQQKYSDKSVVIKMFMAVVLNRNDRLEEAFEIINELIKLSIDTYGPGHFRVATAYSLMAHNLRNQRLVDQSLSYWKKAVVISAQEIDSTFLNSKYTGYDSLVNFYRDLKHLVKTENLIERMHPADQTFFQSIANDLGETGQLDLAAFFFREAGKVYKKQKSMVGMVNSLVGEAIVVQKRQQHYLALDLYKEAMVGYQQIYSEETYAIAWVYHNMAIIYGDLGQFDKQLEYNQRALATRQRVYQEKHHELAASYLSLAITYMNTKQWGKAIHFLNKSLSEGYNDIGYLYSVMGKLYDESDQVDSALFYTRKAIQFSNENEWNFNKYCSAMGELKMKSGDPDSAIYFFQKGVEIQIEGQVLDVLEPQFDLSQVQNPVAFVGSLGKLASAHLARYHQDKMPSDLRMAYQLFESCKPQLKELVTELISEQDLQHLYNVTGFVTEGALQTMSVMFGQTGDEAYFQQAIEIVDLEKSRILMNAIQAKRISSNSASSAILVEYARLKSLVRKLKNKSFEQSLSNDSSRSKGDYDQGFAEINKRISSIMDTLKLEYPQLYHELSGFHDFNASELKSLSKNLDRTIIQYYEGTDSVYLLAASKEHLHFESIVLTDLKNKVERVKEIVKKPWLTDQTTFEAFCSNANALFDLLLRPVLTDHTTDRLLILPDGFLADLPFDVLLTQPPEVEEISFGTLPYALKRLDITYSPSISMSFNNYKNWSKPHSDKMKLKAWAPFSESFTKSPTKDNDAGFDLKLRLGGSQLELQSISENFEAVTYFSEEANESSFKRNIDETNMLHVTTHGIVNSEVPALSYLLFGAVNDSVEDNKLHMYEVYDMSINSDLAVLTACSSGSGKVVAGEGILSLARSFRYAGVHSVIMSFWLANDHSTATITSNFYRHLSLGEMRSEALRKAKLEFLNKADAATCHPYYWAHLVLSGNDRALVQNRAHDTLFWMVIGFFMLLILWVLIKRVFQFKQVYRH